jgi:hypothetical protein
MSVEQKIDELLTTRNQIKQLRHREERLTMYIHDQMNQRRTNRIDTPSTLCHRSVVSRTIMKKDNVPPEIWQEYAEPIEYIRLMVRFN